MARLRIPIMFPLNCGATVHDHVPMPSITDGYFQKPFFLVDASGERSQKTSVIKRITKVTITRIEIDVDVFVAQSLFDSSVGLFSSSSFFFLPSLCPLDSVNVLAFFVPDTMSSIRSRRIAVYNEIHSMPHPQPHPANLLRWQF